MAGAFGGAGTGVRGAVCGVTGAGWGIRWLSVEWCGGQNGEEEPQIFADVGFGAKFAHIAFFLRSGYHFGRAAHRSTFFPKRLHAGLEK